MGIQGLLPILKPIQKQKHLSEFAGQSVAVDAYVWLHRGAYACAVELATNRPTKRYVDYCMQRVRLLRHYKIQPFIVFDGGPLPAKQGTEEEREKKRAENLAKANALAAQGKEGQARDFYVKCVDVTPQMAYQVIKALKAENVPYVVAPYEADAQMTYLERLGFVDAILTEDSDLLVFGCKKVLFKLDPVSATVISISRSDFGSPSLASESLSLIGWSDNQFRWMAMMSGCDYLSSITGIGLKTAHTLLRKHKTVEKAVRAVRLEGKKDVPRGYIDAFKLAEKVFLHQRVYDPSQEQLVYLSDPEDPQGLTEEAELYIGRNLNPALAKKIAEGDACPITLRDMEDINPNFKPKALGSIPLRYRDLNTPVCNRKGKEPSSKAGILNFFTPAPKSTSTPRNERLNITSKSEPRKVIAGKNSGKRTLVEAMEEDMELKRKRASLQRERIELSSSRFFAQQSPIPLIVGPSTKRDDRGAEIGKENTPIVIDSDVEENQGEESVADPVEQEDGYLSPSPSLARDQTPDLSSPVHTRRAHPNKTRAIIIEPLTLEALSSPVQTGVLVPPRRFGMLTQNIPTQEVNGIAEGRVMRLQASGSMDRPGDHIQDVTLGPDLRTAFSDGEGGDEGSACSEISGWEDASDDEVLRSYSPSPETSLTPPELTQHNSQRAGCLEHFVDDLEEEQQAKKISCERIALGWRQRYSHGNSSAPVLRVGIISKDEASHSESFTTASQKRRLSLQESPRYTSKARKIGAYSLDSTRQELAKPSNPRVNEIPSDDIIEEIVHDTKGRLNSFRFSR